MYLCMCVCLSVCLSACVFVCVHMSVCVCVYSASRLDDLLTPAPLSDKSLENHTIFHVPIIVVPGDSVNHCFNTLTHCTWTKPASYYCCFLHLADGGYWRSGVRLSVPWLQKRPFTEKPAVCLSHVVKVSWQQQRTWGSDAGKTRCWGIAARKT